MGHFRSFDVIFGHFLPFLPYQTHFSRTTFYSSQGHVNLKIAVQDQVLLFRDGEFFLNGHLLKVSEFSYKIVNSFELSVKKLSFGAYLLESNSAQISLKWTKTTIFLHIPIELSGRVGGLCGDFNYNPMNDLGKNGVREFVRNQKLVGIDPMPCFDTISSKKPRIGLQDCANRRQENVCKVLKLNSGFRICNQKFDHLPFYESCLDSICDTTTSGKTTEPCEIVSNYAQICMNSRFANLSNWRSSIQKNQENEGRFGSNLNFGIADQKFCQKSCPSNKVFDECVIQECQTTCLSVNDIGHSKSASRGPASTCQNSICTPTCRCPSGLIEAEDGRCILQGGYWNVRFCGKEVFSGFRYFSAELGSF